MTTLSKKVCAVCVLKMYTFPLHMCVLCPSVLVYACVSCISGVRVQRVKQSAYHSQEFRGPECVPLEPKANFEGFLACMAQTDKSPRGSRQTLSCPAHYTRKRLFKHTQCHVCEFVHVCVFVLSDCMQGWVFERHTHKHFASETQICPFRACLSECGQIWWWLLICAYTTWILLNIHVKAMVCTVCVHSMNVTVKQFRL